MRRKITVLINDNHKELYPSENISGVTSESTLTVESVTVFWDYNNVIKGVNDTFSHGGNTLVVPEGYWTSDMITKIRDRLIIRVDTGTLQYYDSIAQLFIEKNGTGGFSAYSSNSSYVINLGSFGTLLGFDKNTALPAQTRKLSQNSADLNRGLKYITVSCDIVDDTRNIGVDGKRSNVIATIPVPNDIDLKHAIAQHYIDTRLTNGIPLQNGCFNNLTFDISTNMGPLKIGSVLLELCINN
jgi:hypothetical protein